MKDITVLIVDDDAITRQTLSMALEDDYATLTAADGQAALAVLAGHKVDLVLTDLDMPGMDGIELLTEINHSESPVPVIMITGQGTIETAVVAMKLGAYDFVIKPVNIDRLLLLIEKTLENKRLKEENILLKQRIKESYPDLNLIGGSPEMQRVLDLALQVAATKATVLIEGESGTGKELVTSIIHYNSPVADGPFIKVNCSAFAEGVLESELFGHEKGAFTGAIATKKGRFELADKGTLFLDEIGDLPLSIQVKLLRFLQERTFERVGGAKTFKVDVRIISATNRNLQELVKEGKFRDDLYYRLRVVRIEVPPLRRRKQDIEPLVRHFVRKYATIHGKPVHGVSEEAMHLMKEYNWPGNVRELINCVESAVVMTRSDVVDLASIPDYVMNQPIGETAGSEEGGLLDDLEKKTMAQVLNETGGDKAKAARKLGIGLRTLYRKIEKYGL